MHRRQATHGFTLVELLVVITIVSVLLALFLPSLGTAKKMAKTIRCGAVQRNLCAVFEVYANDNREFPTNYNHSIPTSWNWGDECSGRMNGGPPSQTAYVYNTPPFYYPAQGASALERVFIGGYLGPRTLGSNTSYWLTNRAILCTGDLTSDFRAMPNNATYPVFNYNGPQTHSSTIKNNGSLSGLYYLGRHAQGETWGLSHKTSPLKFQPADIAFFACPSFYEYKNGGYTGFMIEPHGDQPRANFTAMGYGNGQTDQNNVGLSYNRNYAYGDGHVKYLVTNTRQNIP